MKRTTLWLGVSAACIACATFITFWLTCTRHEGDVLVMKPDKQTQDQRTLRAVAEAGFIELAIEVTYTQMTPTPAGWVLTLSMDGRVKEETDALEVLSALLHELQQTRVEIAAVEAEITTSALRDLWGRRIPRLTVARMRVNGTTLVGAEWRQVQHEHLPDVLDELWIHPALQQEKPQG